MYYYSASNRAFYTKETHGENMPDDVKGPISEEDHAELLNGQSNRKEIAPDDTGWPVLKDPPPPTFEELTVMASGERSRLMALATVEIAPLQDAVDVGDATPEEEARLVTWKQYRIAVSRTTQQPGWPTDVDWPESPQ
ncbi:Caudovirales tail fiber assembly protein [compost metagenome]